MGNGRLGSVSALRFHELGLNMFPVLHFPSGLSSTYLLIITFFLGTFDHSSRSRHLAA